MAKSTESKVLLILLFFLFLAVCLAVFLFLYKPAPAADKWVESGPSAYRRGIDIFSPTPLYDYQVMLYLSLDHTDGSDLRFTYLNSTTGSEIELPFWRVSNPEIGTVWDRSVARGNVVVRVPYISSEGTRIYARYGEGGADKSDPSATYEFFDDFTGSSLDPNLWDTYWNGGLQYTVSQGILHVSGRIQANRGPGDGTITGWHTKDAYGLGTVLETRVSIDHGKGYNYNGDEIGYGYYIYPVNGSSAAFMDIDSSGGNPDGYLLLQTAMNDTGIQYHIDSSYNNWKFIRRNSTSHTAVIGPFLNVTLTKGIPTVEMPITLGGSSFSDSQGFIDYYVDYVLVRKWSDQEPTYVVQGEEAKV